MDDGVRSDLDQQGWVDQPPARERQRPGPASSHPRRL